MTDFLQPQLGGGVGLKNSQSFGLGIGTMGEGGRNNARPKS